MQTSNYLLSSEQLRGDGKERGTRGSYIKDHKKKKINKAMNLDFQK